jgi:GH15 family glucan-1,4-alpha-glucosidase
MVADSCNSFIQAFYSPIIDATSLLVPLQEFLTPDDCRVVGTVEAGMNTLLAENGLVYRHEHDKSHPFLLLCTFWLIKVLAISQKVETAEQLFKEVIDYLNPVGCMSEEIDSDTREFRGNFPQAFSHIGLINAGLYIGIAKGIHYEGPTPLGISTMAGETGKNGSGTGSVY